MWFVCLELVIVKSYGKNHLLPSIGTWRSAATSCANNLFDDWMHPNSWMRWWSGNLSNAFFLLCRNCVLSSDRKAIKLCVCVAQCCDSYLQRVELKKLTWGILSVSVQMNKVFTQRSVPPTACPSRLWALIYLITFTLLTSSRHCIKSRLKHWVLVAQMLLSTCVIMGVFCVGLKIMLLLWS